MQTKITLRPDLGFKTDMATVTAEWSMGLGFKQLRVGASSGSSVSACVARWVPEARARNRAQKGAMQPKAPLRVPLVGPDVGKNVTQKVSRCREDRWATHWTT